MLLADWPGRRADPAQRAWAAVTLHAWYTGVETLIERCLRQLDGDVPVGADSHRRMLDAALLEVPRLRPALVPPTVSRGLSDLLAFRHFFRNAYAVELDPARLEENLVRLREVAARLHPHVDDVADFLERAAMSAQGQ